MFVYNLVFSDWDEYFTFQLLHDKKISNEELKSLVDNLIHEEVSKRNNRSKNMLEDESEINIDLDDIKYGFEFGVCLNSDIAKKIIEILKDKHGFKPLIFSAECYNSMSDWDN